MAMQTQQTITTTTTHVTFEDATEIFMYGDSNRNSVATTVDLNLDQLPPSSIKIPDPTTLLFKKEDEVDAPAPERPPPPPPQLFTFDVEDVRREERRLGMHKKRSTPENSSIEQGSSHDQTGNDSLGWSVSLDLEADPEPAAEESPTQVMYRTSGSIRSTGSLSNPPSPDLVARGNRSARASLRSSLGSMSSGEGLDSSSLRRRLSSRDDKEYYKVAWKEIRDTEKQTEEEFW